MDYLGHSISREGVKPIKQKVEAIENAREPKDFKELQAYLGLINNYGKCIPNLSSELHVLHQLLRKGVKFNWLKEYHECFKKSTVS